MSVNALPPRTEAITVTDWIFVRARADWTPDQFIRWLCDVASPQLKVLAREQNRCRIHVVPAEKFDIPGFLTDEGAANSETRPLHYDAALMIETKRDKHWQECAAVLAVGAAAVHAVRARATVVKDQDAHHGEHAPELLNDPGVTYLRPITFHTDMAPSAARRSWDLHAPFAVRTHVGASRYVQWWVESMLTTECPPIAGIVELRFPTDKELGAQFFPSPFAREDIARDTGHFIAAGPRLYTKERELR
jgi:hypothetical protein